MKSATVGVVVVAVGVDGDGAHDPNLVHIRGDCLSSTRSSSSSLSSVSVKAAAQYVSPYGQASRLDIVSTS